MTLMKKLLMERRQTMPQHWSSISEGSLVEFCPLSSITDFDFVRVSSMILGGRTDMPGQSLISDLMSLTERYSSDTLSQSSITVWSCSLGTTMAVAVLDWQAELMTS